MLLGLSSVNINFLRNPKIDIIKAILSKLPHFIVALFLLYTIGAFAAPVFYKLGYTDWANNIELIYSVFCHQFPERSLFLFGQDRWVGFYSVSDLVAMGITPESRSFVGNDQIGYKVAFCSRDMAMYLAYVTTSFIYIVSRSRRMFSWKLLFLLMAPMAIDGVFQTLAINFNWSWVPQAYIEDINKRLVTGALFGIGFGLMVMSNLLENIGLIYDNKGYEDSNTKKNV